MVWPQLRHLRWLLQMYQCLGEAHGVTITHSPSDVGIDFFFSFPNQRTALWLLPVATAFLNRKHFILGQFSV